ncbi:Lipoprotein-releasing system ATP-binding protein LolD [Zhongshania aliphaticivorans]|uniref:Lipoprotein-releasing system ATP-binding protein LolD n=1 Tax=Zhongshania aliphaticivorans TaxID=1470434 RepID=A0A5S9QQ00_9GAMM|nr:ATP-binding cassette domain-containing protein [Zhongshania aliphaticivorans]CAA0087692.1 Lipoprotein-releasing system ATP-binding protein LolD [Zhongshania aliphaticivorans]CAA0115327.1 Lipoprotein-releasing system ATP-binding protein LolD [Zhongshania aliphaticivorans]CAA0120155.1 Lipoprotein-releasing system ATP-binding protein LolD [Zhongshania aliphaticivorans]
MIRVNNLCKTVVTGGQELDILKGINFKIKAGESVAIVGASGAGKSTLLGLLAGLDDASSGDIILHEENLSLMNEDERAALRAKHVGFVFQSFQLLAGMTALENVMLPLELAGHRSPASTAKKFLDKVGLADRAGHYPRVLSGGEQQRVALARAFAVEPNILFADEPTGNLDEQTGQRIIDLLFELNKQSKTTLVLVTHELGLARRCERTLLMHDGLLTETPSDSDSSL